MSDEADPTTERRGARLLVTVGDPRGIGPEVMAEAVRRHRADHPRDTCLILGPDRPDPAGSRGSAGAPGSEEPSYEGVGAFDGSPESAGTLSARAVRTAVERCLAGEADGIVTGPLHKPALRAAGVPFPGHTEMLRHLAAVEEVGMLMAAEETRIGGPLRVLLATTHLPLREVPGRLTASLLETRTRLLDDALRRRWGIASPRIALCAFNPHASDGGLFGDEEARVYGPAVAALHDGGIDASEPLPADTVFSRALAGEFDAVVAPYHDVGMAAFKTVSFGTGVNVTLGLPFVRTSPDHGTAFDIAGTGRADPSSAVHALTLAARLALP